MRSIVPKAALQALRELFEQMSYKSYVAAVEASLRNQSQQREESS